MPEMPWKDDDTSPDFDPLGIFLSDWADPEAEEEEFRSDFFQGLSGRRQKAAFVFMAIWGITFLLHWLTWGALLVAILAFYLLASNLRLILARPDPTPQPLPEQSLLEAPNISLLIAAKNEEAVIQSLVEQLCHLDYPSDKYEVWIVDDRSSDRTPEILDRLARQYELLKVVRRPAGAGGGKSGALNQVLPLTRGEIIGVFDADALVPADLLRCVAPLFAEPELGAVQVRKAIANTAVNFWTQGQSLEMAFDAYLQQQRIALGGIGELRGNGQFVRRSALDSCGGWNEQTITDDLDLTIRLHLDNWKVGCLSHPAVKEEGVTTATALWHQRNRWAEGGYQRYLDYWRYILHKPLGIKKKVDLITFLSIQYLLPTAAVPDLMVAIARHRLPLLSPVTGAILSLSVVAIWSGLRRTQSLQGGWREQFLLLGQTLKGTIYLMHWFAIVPSVTARMSIRPKQLKWVKTVHAGVAEENLEFKNS